MRRLSWRAKLVALITLVLGVLLLVQLLYIIPHVKNQEMAAAEAQQAEIARNIARELEIDVAGIEDRLTRIAEREEFHDMDIAAQQSTMTQHTELSLLLESLFVMDAEGWFVSGTADDLYLYQTKSHADKPYFIVSFGQGETYHDATARAYSNGTLVATTLGVPIESETGERVGVLLGTIRLNELIELVENYPLHEGTVAAMVDKEGTVVACSGIDMFTLEEGPLSVNYTISPMVQDIMVGEKNEGRVYVYDDIPPYFGTYSILETNGWGVIVETPMSVIWAEANALAMWLLAINIVLYAIALLVTLVFTRQIVGEQKRAEEALRESEEKFRQKSVELEQKNIELLRVNELKSEFVANMSHELRTPMNAIMGYTSLMLRQRYGTLTEKQTEALWRVDRNAKNLLNLITNILDLSKTEAGKMPLYNEEVDLRELLEEVIATVEPMVREAKLALETAVAQDIPALWTDRSKLKQTILNLLSNAVKFTPKGRITVSAWGSDGNVNVAVKDTGIGIREEDLKVIFEEFQQVDGSTTRDKGGTGLGLAIARKFANLLGGDIEVESVYGQGSTFTITIPYIAPT